MRKIDAHKLQEELDSLCAYCSTKNYDEWTMMIVKGVIQDQPTIEDDTICECNLADNAALICEILNADAKGERSSLLDAEGDDDYCSKGAKE